MFTQAKLTTTSNEQLIEWLEKKGLKKEAESLKNGATQLNLNYNQIGDDGTKEIAEALKTNNSLTHLNLEGNQIRVEGAKAIAEALKANNSLTEFSLYRNQIGNEGAEAIAAALKANNSLTELSLYGNQIGNAEDQKIKEKINYNKELFQKLTSLLYNFFENKGNTDYAFKVLTANKFYQVANKQLLKKHLVEKGAKDIEIKLKELDEFINQKVFTIAGVCKKLAPNNKILNDEKHISDLPNEIITHIISYLEPNSWGEEVEVIGNNVIIKNDAT